ncbi:hypothetical protein E2C01_055632 [Portunus trituberculatus]|uniref:Uncharacterized protein n=1 Tax=Portunus trituberculatus TaxID=210409 RepID=A0A5B7GVJ3_PORTR|nr:hypothetical protein [Portunus trituberculatus]
MAVKVKVKEGSVTSLLFSPDVTHQHTRHAVITRVIKATLPAMQLSPPTTRAQLSSFQLQADWGKGHVMASLLRPIPQSCSRSHADLRPSHDLRHFRATQQLTSE